MTSNLLTFVRVVPRIEVVIDADFEGVGAGEIIIRLIGESAVYIRIRNADDSVCGPFHDYKIVDEADRQPHAVAP